MMDNENKNTIEQEVDKWMEKQHGSEGLSNFFNTPPVQAAAVASPNPPAHPQASSSIAPVIDAMSTGMQWLKNKAPDAAKPYADAASSVLGTSAGRWAARQFVPDIMYNHELSKAGAQQEQNANAQLRAIDQARVQQNLEHEKNIQSHAGRADALKAELQLAEFEYQKAHRNHQTALAQEDAARIRNPELELEKERRMAGANRPALGFQQATPMAQPQFSPEGGPATEKYGLGFGLSGAQAREAPSMSHVQQKTIPGNVGGIEQARNVDPTNRRVVGSELALLPEGQRAVAERNAAAQLEAERAKVTQEQFEQEQRRLRLEKEQEIAKHRANTKRLAEEAELNRKEAEKVRSEARKALQTHHQNTPPTPSDTGISAEAKARADAAYARKNQRIPKNKILGTFARIGARLAPRFAPIAGAAFAPIEADLARKDYDAGNYLRAGMHGSGAIGAGLQATGIPLAMGVGDVMQFPAGGLMMYDTIQDYANRNPNKATQSNK